MAKTNYPQLTRHLLTRLFAKIKISTEHSYNGVPCWEWTGSISKRTGYGQVSSFRYMFLAHRMFYHLFVEALPGHLVCDHLCRIRHCVNPAHIEATTAKVNTARAVWSRKPGAKEQTHCKHGHPLSGDNLKWEKNYVNDASRGGNVMRKVCRECRNRRGRERTQRKKLARLAS